MPGRVFPAPPLPPIYPTRPTRLPVIANSDAHRFLSSPRLTTPAAVNMAASVMRPPGPEQRFPAYCFKFDNGDLKREARGWHRSCNLQVTSTGLGYT